MMLKIVKKCIDGTKNQNANFVNKQAKTQKIYLMER
jgi:hypothetical protein